MKRIIFLAVSLSLFVSAGVWAQDAEVAFLYSFLQGTYRVIGKWPDSNESYNGKEIEMITALVQFKLPQPLSREKAREIFAGTAPKYREINGLIRKYYVLSQDGGTAGGVYLWNSQEDAERLYTNEWKEFIFDKYGALPSVTYFESPVIVDNITGEIIT